jgi:hypothetical protein
MSQEEEVCTMNFLVVDDPKQRAPQGAFFNA